MCYSVYLATDSKQDLASSNEEQIYFQKIVEDEEILRLLKCENKWYVGSSSGCSCSFRHLLSCDLGFSEPVDWYHEEAEFIEATKKFYQVISNLINEGHQVECLDTWEDPEPEDIQSIEVDISSVSESQFRLFENYLFKFKKT